MCRRIGNIFGNRSRNLMNNGQVNNLSLGIVTVNVSQGPSSSYGSLALQRIVNGVCVEVNYGGSR